ncbi:MAG: DUF58 domain-containing protein [Candidatus Dactylopiibacterium sp.]|nr:DUF58 domain-containing protein [Candidatus Dactylopiibacterium sp.]
MLPTRAGVALLVTLVTMLLASINYNLSLGYALVFLLGSVFVTHILHTWRTLVGLRLECARTGEAFVGGRAAWLLRVFNDATHERAGLRVRDAEGALLAQTHLAGAAHAELRIELTAPRRGLQNPGPLTVESTQPLGWIRAWSYLAPDAPQPVYPAPHGARALPSAVIASTEAHGSTHTALRGQGDDFAGLRTGQATDSPRHIAWKQYAQGKGLLTKTWASPATSDCVLDWRALPPALPLEERLSQLCAWVLSARRAGLRTTLILPDGTSGPGEDAAHHEACLLRLALYGHGGRP